MRPTLDNEFQVKHPMVWKKKKLKDFINKIVGGGTPSRAKVDYWNGNIFWASVKDISSFNPFSTQEKITELGLKNSSSNLIPKGTLITATRMSLGKVVNYEIDVAINQDLKAIFPKDNLDAKFLQFWFEKNVNFIQKLGIGSTVVGISLNDLYGLDFYEVPLTEQKAIAACLNKWDDAITKTNQLIEQKELRRKWLMQQLLTGKRRLKGFSGEWIDKEFGELFNHIKNVNDGGNSHPVMTISSKLGLISQEDKFDRIIAGESLKKYTQLKNGDFAYNKGNSKTYPMGCIYRLEEKQSALVPFVYICFSPTESVDGLFYKYWFSAHGVDRQLNRIITSGARGDGLLNVNSDDFFKIKILYPPKEEQTAIAKILQAADKEIELLKYKRDQLKEQKKGLMQQLLTGKKRLKI